LPIPEHIVAELSLAPTQSQSAAVAAELGGWTAWPPFNIPSLYQYTRIGLARAVNKSETSGYHSPVCSNAW